MRMAVRSSVDNCIGTLILGEAKMCVGLHISQSTWYDLSTRTQHLLQFGWPPPSPVSLLPKQAGTRPSVGYISRGLLVYVPLRVPVS